MLSPDGSTVAVSSNCPSYIPEAVKFVNAGTQEQDALDPRLFGGQTAPISIVWQWRCSVSQDAEGTHAYRTTVSQAMSFAVAVWFGVRVRSKPGAGILRICENVATSQNERTAAGAWTGPS